MGSLGGITGNPAAHAGRLQGDGKVAQVKPGAAAYIAGAPEALDEDVLISTVLDIGAVAEAAADHEDLPQATPSDRALTPQHPLPFTTDYTVSLTAAVSAPAESRQPPAHPDPRTLPAARIAARWFGIALLALAAFEALLIWSAASGR